MSGNLKTLRVALVCLFALMGMSLSAQTVKGNVKDSSGEPVIGATVQEKGTKNIVATDLDGNFSIGLTSGKQLQISYIGMKTKTVNVAGKTSVNVTMEDEATGLNDVVVIGYGTVRKKDLTGSVASVSAKELANIPVSTAAEAMQGKLAGVNVMSTEGSPDAEVTIRVRGGGSISQDNSPLFIVDGFPVSSISDIAPSDIETIDVLKDASSTAIYGARGANGVIIITTKGGKEGKVNVNFNASLGVRKISNEIEVLDPYNFALYQYEMGNTGYGDYDDLEIWKSVKGNDWQDKLFGRTGIQQIYNLSVSGGTKETKFNVSYSRTDDKSIMLASDFTKDNINAKLNTQINKWLSLDFNARMSYQVVNGLSSGADITDNNVSNSLVNKTITFRPVDPLTEDVEEDEDKTSSSEGSPYDRMLDTYKQQRRFRQNYNAGINWKPFKHLTLRSEFGYSWYNAKSSNAYGCVASKNSPLGYSGRPQSEIDRDESRNWRNANTITYDNKNIFTKDDRLNVLVGQEWSSSQTDVYRTYSVNFPTSMTLPEVLANQGAGLALNNYSNFGRKDNMVSFFGRINYTYADKYLFTATLRADGSSKFAKGNRWGYFPSAAIAWRISEEGFMKDINWLSNLKARLSFGTAGNNRIKSGLVETTYDLTDAKAKAPYFNELVAVMLYHNTLANPDLKWETTITRNFGIDYGFLGGRINGTLDFYWNTTKDLLMQTQIPTISGYQYQYQNFGQTSNKGVELTVNASIVEKKNFTLNFTGNISYNRNKIDKLNTDTEFQNFKWAGSTFDDNENFRIVEGGRIGEVWGYKTKGFYTAYDANTNPDGDLIWNGKAWTLREGVLDEGTKVIGGQLKPGALKIEVDENGKALKQRLGNTIAPWQGGFGLNATFHGFDASVFCNFSLGNKRINGAKMISSFYGQSRKGYNINGDFTNRYTGFDIETGLNLYNPSNADVVAAYGSPEAAIARLNEINSNASIYNPVVVNKMSLISDYVESASFLRVQNVTLGYTLPKSVVNKLFLSNVRFYFTGYNLLTITGYSGSDPEADTQSKKNPMCPGIDIATYPKSRLYVFGVNVSF
ncbi:TonB-dependent receptor [Prevotella sp. PCHR]|uniref:TonB-dependent receptor n=3 Tax=Xylanibacter caecicola TaxID=2736294 RepID=A0ABX2B455_9BACT|nr:TonB-dependent receptor [Xylanibacter caecicola]NPE25192.1 TonB-dependent receptor [Xylanibacter caecicola]